MGHYRRRCAVAIVMLCASGVGAHGADDELFRRTFFEIVATLSEPYFYGDDPQDYDLPMNLPPAHEIPEASCPRKLRDFAATSRRVTSELQVADIIRSKGLQDAMDDELVRRHPQAKRAAEHLARLKQQQQPQQAQEEVTSFADEAFMAGFRAVREGNEASQRQYREALGLPDDESDGFVATMFEAIGMEAVRQFAAHAIENTDSLVSNEAATSIERSADIQRQKLLQAMFSQSGYELERSSGPQAAPLPIDWFVHYEPKAGTLCLQAVNRADQTLEDVIIRIHSKLSGIRTKQRCSSFTFAIPTWERGKSIVVSSAPLARLRLTKSRGADRSMAKWSTSKLPLGGLVATVYAANARFFPHHLILPPKSSPVRPLEVGDDQRSVILRLQAQSFISVREWRIRGQSEAITATIIKKEPSQITLQLSGDNRTRIVPLSTLSASDRTYLKSLADPLANMSARSWTIRPETRIQATFAGLDNIKTVRLHTGSGETKLVSLADLLPQDQQYLAILVELR